MLTVFHNVLDWAPLGLPAFVFVITFVVGIHELGHFLVARLFGVGVETFSIGFGNEIFGWTDRKGTRWKVSWLPIGGYVKFLGDEDAASTPDRERLAQMNAEERSHTLPYKPLVQRVLVAAAGPAANFLLAIVVFTFLFTFFGVKALSTYVGSVTPKSPAAMAGIKPGDKITAIDHRPVRLFAELPGLIDRSNGRPLDIAIDRNGEAMVLSVTPRVISTKDIYGTPVKVVAIGVGFGPDTPENTVYVPIPILEAPLAAVGQTWGIVDMTFTYLWRIVSHHADASQLGGPIGMAQMAKSAASHGPYELVYLLAFISVSIGLINLFPIPLLDGGHLLYYGCEAVLGRPLGEQAQDLGFRLGLALVLGLMIFATWNDLVR
ncbi:MAG: RIP metalloprotease RseP [Alphaproteobacteria bacterium]|nr:RIP metalloprotease RseP [Alphaproteobacteria bacterium]MDE2111763.1 RIP metalloprotease RseP [Alphaproteobacteria bacterium]MDE2494023.1 RIP metalloprotease RseP [Alphaproteobacteria bacterium]